MRYYEELATFERDGFLVFVDKADEDLNPRDQFEEEDVPEILRKIENYTYDWFMLRVRVMLDGHEMGTHYLGGCLYEDAKQVLTDGTVEDCLIEAMHEARQEVRRLKEKLNAFAV